MKLYNLNTVFNFGKHKGKTLQEIVEIENFVPWGNELVKVRDENSYLNWCIIKIEDFCISNHVIEKIKHIKPGFYLSDDAKNSLKLKYEIIIDTYNQKKIISMVESEELLIEPLFKFVEEKGSINTLVTVSERALHTKINGEYIEIIHPIKKITKIINKNKLCVDDEFIAEICWIKANNNISENDLINYHKLEGSILYHYKLDLLLGTSRLFLLKSEFEINK